MIAALFVLCFFAIAASAQSSPAVLGFKSVRQTVDAVPGGPLTGGDTIRWTIDYINNSPDDVLNFQIHDIAGGLRTVVPGSNVIRFVSTGSVAVANPAYDGDGDDETSDLLAAGAVLKAGGRIQVSIDMLISQGTDSGTALLNQAAASGSNIVTPVLTDNIDSTNFEIFGPGTTPPEDSIPQYQNPASIDPTMVIVKGAPTSASASISGQVRDFVGVGIAKATITIVNASNGGARQVTTNAFGFYSADDLPVGDIYFVSVSHKRYTFAQPFVTFTLNDNLTGLSFVANAPVGKGPKKTAFAK